MNGIEFLYEYMLFKESFIEADLIQLNNNLQSRDPDYLDYLELILAQCRLDTSREIFRDIRFLLKTLP